MSLSARRAWIEIYNGPYSGLRPSVALRKESVDRNNKSCGKATNTAMSLSARRAWIEIGESGRTGLQRAGSLSARRAWIEMLDLAPRDASGNSRSPQGERG